MRLAGVTDHPDAHMKVEMARRNGFAGRSSRDILPRNRGGSGDVRGWAVFFCVTGGLGLCALNSTILTVAIWMLAIPGLLLCLAANLFLIGWLFFFADFLGQSTSPRVRVGLHIGTLVLVVGALIAIPTIRNRDLEKMAARLSEADVNWRGTLFGTKTLALLGEVHGREKVCSELCLKLLYAGNAEAVLIGDPPVPGRSLDSVDNLKKYRVDHRGSCASVPNASPNVLLRLAAGDCLIGEPGSIGDTDAVWIVSTVTGLDQNRPISGLRRSVQLRSGAEWHEVHRVTTVSIKHYMTPLLLGPGGTPMAMRLEPVTWTRTMTGNASSATWLVGIDDFFRPTNSAPASDHPPSLSLPLGSPIANDVAAAPAMAEALRRVVADTTLPPTSPAFQLVGPYLLAVSAGAPGDTGLIGDLIRDPRVANPGGVVVAFSRLGPNAASLAAPIFDRAMTNLAKPQEDQSTWSLANAFRYLPPCAAKGMRTQLEQLAKDPVMRRRAAPMLARLADSGPEVLPLLLDLIQPGRFVTPQAKGSTIYPYQAGQPLLIAGLDGLEILGPEGREAIPIVEQIFAEKAATPWGSEVVEHAVAALVRMEGAEAARRLIPADKMREYEGDIRRAESLSASACGG